MLRQEVEEDIEAEDEDPDVEEENEEYEEENEDGEDDEDDGEDMRFDMRFSMGSDGECDDLDDLPSSRGNQWKGPICRKASQTSVYLQEWDIPYEQLDLGELIGKVRILTEIEKSDQMGSCVLKCFAGARAAGVGCTRVGGTGRSPSVCSRSTGTTRTT